MNIFEKKIHIVEKKLKHKDEAFWINRGEKHVLKLFHDMAERVPAYADFLKKNSITHTSVRTISDFSSIPSIDKDSYLRYYPREALCWDGNFSRTQSIISTTSGSTGKPFYFPRTEEQNRHYALTAELYLRENFSIHEKTTLYVDAFPMGPWIGGVFTYDAIRLIAKKNNYPLSIITTSIDKQAIIDSIVELGGSFEQIIIGCYGPFLKDVIDEGISQGIVWSKYNIRFIFSAEVFSEEFRDYIFEKTSGFDIFRFSLNHYGTVDLGTMAHETPLSIFLRRMAVSDSKIYSILFDNVYKLPTFCQFVPEMFYFEEIDGGLFCSARSGIPLVRYDLKDAGGVRTFGQIYTDLKNVGHDLSSEIVRANLQHTVWNIPFVYVYERKDFSVSLYAFQVYPETVRKVVQSSLFETYITGKFTMMVQFDEKNNQYLEVHVEKKKGVLDTDVPVEKITEEMIKTLLRENSEYAKTYQNFSYHLRPKVVLWEHEHPLHFKSGVKQKWVKRTL